VAEAVTQVAEAVTRVAEAVKKREAVKVEAVKKAKKKVVDLTQLAIIKVRKTLTVAI